MPLTFRLFRVLGYIVITVVTIVFYTENIADIWTITPLFWFLPIFAWCGWELINFKKKAFPFSRTEKIILCAFEVVIAILMVLRIILLIIAI